MPQVLQDKPVGRPKSKGQEQGEPKRYGTLIRVTDAFAEAIRDAAHAEKLSVSEFAERYFLPIAQKRYKDAVIREAKRLEGK